MTEEDRAWLGLAHIQGLGTRGAHNLIKDFGAPDRVYTASLTELEAAGLASRIARDITAQAGLAESDRAAESADKLGAQVVTPASVDYPPLLREISDPPLALYVQGPPAELSRPAVAMVGSRKPSAYGAAAAHRLAADLALRNLTIVSGLARGIDSACHRGALESKGRTVAVLGSGVDVVYPKENRKLAESIVAQGGAVVSEFPLGTAPMPENFPIRNRIISGLSLGVVVVEAAEYSGSLITARLALEQNREVFAVPGNITSAQSFGPNMLIKQGAKLVDRWSDVLEELPAAARVQLAPPENASENGEAPVLPFGPPAPLEGDEKAVFEALRADQALFVDAICGSVTIPQPRVLAALLGLEMGGLVRQLPGLNFVRKL